MYHCRDCSYQGKQRSAEGSCPACGSPNYKRPGARDADDKPRGSSPLKLALLIGLWAFLIFEIHRKLYGS